MSNLKNNLIQLIEAYADSKSTSNQLLQSIMVEKLNSFLESIDVVKVQSVEVTEE